MKAGARTPEELETLLEDAFLEHHPEAIAELFTDWAVLARGDGAVEARGSNQIASRAAAICALDHTYIARPQRILQARDTVLVVAEHALKVAVRGEDRAWRYAIASFEIENQHKEEQR